MTTYESNLKRMSKEELLEKLTELKENRKSMTHPFQIDAQNAYIHRIYRSLSNRFG